MTVWNMCGSAKNYLHVLFRFVLFVNGFSVYMLACVVWGLTVGGVEMVEGVEGGEGYN
jgi:hypothetical protein